MRIGDICTRYAVEIDPESTVTEAAMALRDTHVGALVVVDRRQGAARPIGILTDRDIVISVLAKAVDSDGVTVADVMTRGPAICHEDDDVFDAISRMRRIGVRRLPVVNAAGVLIGMLSSDDLLGAIAAELGDLSRAFSRQQAQEARLRD